jgi:hypothetical protein
VRLPGTPANKNAGKPATVEAPANGKRPRVQKAGAPEGDAAKPKRAKRPAPDAPEGAKSAGKAKKGTPEDGTEKPSRRKQPRRDEPGDGAGNKKPKDPGKSKKSREEKDKDGEPFKPSVTFGDITAAVAGAAESAAQFASGQVQNGAAFMTGG